MLHSAQLTGTGWRAAGVSGGVGRGVWGARVSARGLGGG